MEYIVTRTSAWDTKPCDEAVRVPVLWRDQRNVDDPEKLHFASDRENWYLDGKNHRVVDGYITRDMDDMEWTIEINSLDELMAFVDKHGGSIVIDNTGRHNLPYLEIYDDYRE